MSTLMLRTTKQPIAKTWSLMKGLLFTVSALSAVWVFELVLPLLGVELGGLGWLLRGAALGTSWLPFRLGKTTAGKEPNVLFASDEKITLLHNDKELFMLYWNDIASFSYVDKNSTYGIAFVLKSSQHSAEALEKGMPPNELPLLLEGLERIAKKEAAKEPISTTLPAISSHLPPVLVEETQKNYGVDIFLPYFSKPSYQLLKQWHEETIPS